MPNLCLNVSKLRLVGAICQSVGFELRRAVQTGWTFCNLLRLLVCGEHNSLVTIAYVVYLHGVLSWCQFVPWDLLICAVKDTHFAIDYHI